MANETIENEITLEEKIDQTTASQKLDEKAKKETAHNDAAMNL